jgi:hypothetical protein
VPVAAQRRQPTAAQGLGRDGNNKKRRTTIVDLSIA